MNRTHAQRTLVLALVLALLAAPAVAGVAVAQDDPPSPPATYYGTVTVDGETPETTFTVKALVDGEVRDSIETESDGTFGGAGTFDEKLTVDGESGDKVAFVIGSTVLETVDWESAANEEITLDIADPDTATELAIELGSTTIEEGDTTDVTVTASFADGTEETVTADATITSSDTDVATVDGSTVVGVAAGTTTVKAEYEGLTVSTTLTVEADESPGGGGGAQPSEPEEPDAPGQTVADVAGTSPTVTVEAAQSISEIGFEMSTETEATVSITEVTESPAPEPEGATFVAGADITFESGDSENVETVRMSVQSDAIADLGVSADQLVLHHLDDETGEWEALETEVVSDETGNIVVSAPSAGFSHYAVFAQEDEDVTTTTTTQQPTTTTETPTTTTDAPPTTTEEPTDEGPGALLIGGILVVVLALIGALYLAYGRE